MGTTRPLELPGSWILISSQVTLKMRGFTGIIFGVEKRDEKRGIT